MDFEIERRGLEIIVLSCTYLTFDIFSDPNIKSFTRSHPTMVYILSTKLTMPAGVF